MMRFWWSPQTNHATSSLPGLSAFPSSDDFQSSSIVNLPCCCCYHFLLLVVEYLCWLCMIAIASWKKKRFWETLPSSPNPNRHLSKLGFTHIAKINKEKKKQEQNWYCPFTNAGKSKIIGRLQVTEFRLARPVDETAAGFKMNRKWMNRFSPGHTTALLSCKCTLLNTWVIK